jgi:small ligand-binding sensory domain FIST
MLGFPLDSLQPRFDGESCLVRHVLGFDQKTGGIVVPDRLDGQTSMIFMHRNAEQAERDMRRMTGALHERLEGVPDFGIYFDCAARGRRLYGREGVDTSVIRAQLGEFPLIGMFGGFELATTQGFPMLYTYTGVLILVRGH